MEVETALEKIGLNKSEIKVYLSLVGIGESTVTPIVRYSKVSKSKVYDVLEKLIQKGLVSFIIKDKKRYYLASDPIQISNYLEKQKEENEKLKEIIDSIIPDIRKKSEENRADTFAEIYHGEKGYQTLREEALRKMIPKQELLIIGAPSIANSKMEAWLLEFHKKREKRKVGMKIIYNNDAKEYGEKREILKFTQVKYLPKGLMTPSWIEVFNNQVIIGVIGTKGIFCFNIVDSDVSKSFEKYFYLLWDIAKK
jgi:sugar-specific transcriptional regulator TrmB